MMADITAGALRLIAEGLARTLLPSIGIPTPPPTDGTQTPQECIHGPVWYCEFASANGVESIAIVLPGPSQP